MCGRAACTLHPQQIVDATNSARWSESKEYTENTPYKPGYNIPPTSTLPVLTLDQCGERIVTGMRWGLVPSYSITSKPDLTVINARSESVSSKKMFRNLLPQNRCVVVVEGYYEWQYQGNDKTPFLISQKDRPVIYLAGLYDRHESADGKKTQSFAIITTAAVGDVTCIHDRMPLILETEEEVNDWLDPDTTEDCMSMISSLKAKTKNLKFYAVAPCVNSIKNNTPECLMPLESYKVKQEEEKQKKIANFFVPRKPKVKVEPVALENKPTKLEPKTENKPVTDSKNVAKKKVLKQQTLKFG